MKLFKASACSRLLFIVLPKWLTNSPSCVTLAYVASLSHISALATAVDNFALLSWICFVTMAVTVVGQSGTVCGLHAINAALVWFGSSSLNQLDPQASLVCLDELHNNSRVRFLTAKFKPVWPATSSTSTLGWNKWICVVWRDTTVDWISDQKTFRPGAWVHRANCLETAKESIENF